MSKTSGQLAKAVLDCLGTAFASGIVSEASADLYRLLKEYVSQLPPQEQQVFVSKVSIVKPGTFLLFEVDRVSREAASALADMPPAARDRLVRAARQHAADESQVVARLVELALKR